jgi:hypothetical protein
MGVFGPHPFPDVNWVVEGKRFAVSPPFLDVNQVAPTNGGAKSPAAAFEREKRWVVIPAFF